MMETFLQNKLVWVYFLIGLGLLIYLCLKAFFEYQSKSDFAKSIRDNLGVKETLKEKLQALLVYCLSGLVVLLAWPIFIGWVCLEWLRERQDLIERSKPQFDCKNEFLIKRVSPLEAEQNSLVHDPLGMTPAIPFGHLNGVWCDFLSQLEEDDTIWYFEIPKDCETGNKYHRCINLTKGFAQVRSNQIIAEFITQSN